MTSIPSAQTPAWSLPASARYCASLPGPSVTRNFSRPVALFILGIGAWTFFRQLKLSPLAATLGALAAMLTSTLFSDACWGAASHQIAFGMDFLALALIVSNSPATPWFVRWVRLALAGFAVGINVVEAADIGAIFSLFVAAFALFQSFTEDGTPVKKIGRGVGRITVIAAFAAFFADSNHHIAGRYPDCKALSAPSKTRQTRQPIGTGPPNGVFPKSKRLESLCRVCSAIGWTPPMAATIGARWGVTRHGIAILPTANKVRRQRLHAFLWHGQLCRYPGHFGGVVGHRTIACDDKNSVFSATHRRFLWFWTAVLMVSLLLAFGRFAPFYALLYLRFPYFSTIRNPIKFLFVFSWAMRHHFCLWHPRAEPALSGNSGHRFRFTAWASSKRGGQKPAASTEIGLRLASWFS